VFQGLSESFGVRVFLSWGRWGWWVPIAKAVWAGNWLLLRHWSRGAIQEARLESITTGNLPYLGK